MRYFLYLLLAFFVGAVLVFLYELIRLYLEQWFDVDWTGTSAADWEDFDGLHAVGADDAIWPDVGGERLIAAIIYDDSPGEVVAGANGHV